MPLLLPPLVSDLLRAVDPAAKDVRLKPLEAWEQPPSSVASAFTRRAGRALQASSSACAALCLVAEPVALCLLRRAKLGQEEQRAGCYPPSVARAVGLRAADGKSIQDFTITDTPYAFVVEGEAIERFTQMTNWDYFESYKRFGRVLDMSGVDEALNAAGAGEGDRVMIGDFEFEWSKDKRDRTLYETFKRRVADAPGAPRGSRHWPHAV